MICPNCGQETEGDLCQWCGYPMMRSSLDRRQRASREVAEAKERAKVKARETGEAERAEERAREEAELAAKEKAKRKAEKAKEKAKKEAEKAKEAKRAEEKAKKEAELAAKEKAKREAKEAKEKAKREAEKAKEAERVEEIEEEAEPAVVTKLYKGVVELTIMSPIDLGQLENLEEDLRRVENLRLVLVGGSVDKGNRIVVSAEESIPLLRILRELPSVEQVVRKGSEIQVTLKAK